MYVKRDSEKILEKFATQYPVVTITGPRQSGKTTICKKTFPNKKYVSLEDIDYRDYAATDPRAFLAEFSGGVIIDEIQRVPNLLSYIQTLVDKNDMKGEFILTGSSQFELSNQISQSLAGRTMLLKLYPFSYTEIYDKADNNREWINKVIYTGFYPRIFKDNLDPTDNLAAYLETYVDRDIRLFSDIKDLKSFRTFLRLCAARIAQPVNFTSISNEIGVSLPTIKNWMSILEQSYIIYLLQPYYKNINKRLIKTPKLYFYDVGLCAYLNGAKRFEHIDNLPNRGSLFENFIISELVKIDAHNNLKNQFYFFKNKNGMEVDLIVDNGMKLFPIEIKSAQTFNETFLKNLKYFYRFNSNENLGKIIYSGSSQNRSNFEILNYHELFKDFSENKF